MEEYKQKTRDSYNKNSVFHAQRFTGLMDLLRRKEFSRFIEFVPGKKILDVGCGGGDHSLFFMQQGFDVTAIDFSEQMVALCREKGVSAQVMDLENMTFAPETFDGVWSVTSLLHIPKKNMSAVAQSLQTLLKPGGILYVCVKEGEGEAYVPDKDGESERFFSYWQMGELAAIFKQFFEVLDFEKVTMEGRIFLQFFFRKK